MTLGFGVQALAASTVSIALTAYSLVTTAELSWNFAMEDPPAAGGEPLFETVFDYKSDPTSAHSPAISIFEDRAQILWFDGTREGHEDVVIKSVDIVPGDTSSGWKAGEIGELFDRHTLATMSHPRREIWTLGNTIQLAANEETILATVVSVGGWSAASLAKVEFESGGVSDVRPTWLSPMLNRSHLVRNSTFRYTDGSVGIPAYFAMGNAFGELVRLDRAGNVADKRRITQGRLGIQPDIVILGSKNAVALQRNYDDHSDRLVASWTEDGGRSWGTPKFLDLPNPNSPVAAIRLSDGRILMAFNDDPVHNHTLSLAISSDQGHRWERIAVLENGEGDVRYPDFARLNDGSILLTYSFDTKMGIRAHVFNQAWVDAQ